MRGLCPRELLPMGWVLGSRGMGESTSDSRGMLAVVGAQGWVSGAQHLVGRRRRRWMGALGLAWPEQRKEPWPSPAGAGRQKQEPNEAFPNWKNPQGPIPGPVLCLGPGTQEGSAASRGPQGDAVGQPRAPSIHEHGGIGSQYRQLPDPCWQHRWMHLVLLHPGVWVWHGDGCSGMLMPGLFTLPCHCGCCEELALSFSIKPASI